MPAGPSDPLRGGADFGALDGWRGVCACLVALFHFQSVLGVPVNSHVMSAAVVRHAYLFVDFFFVLSGFVIASRYQERISSSRISVGGFLALRLGRLYPLHLFTLLGMMVMYTYVGSASDAVIGLHAAPIDRRVWSFLANIFMVQGLHTTSAPTWNHPSWSISTEFAAYVAYALIWKTLKRRSWIATLCIVIAAPAAIALLVGNMDTTFDWGILRSLLGFALGAAAFNWQRRPVAEVAAAWVGAGRATLLEIVVLIVVGAFIAQPDHTLLTIAAPFVFAIAVLVFSRGLGRVSALLASRAFRRLGAISYSIYLLHQPLQELLMVTALWCYGALGWTWLFGGDALTTGLSLGASGFAGDAMTAAMLIVLVAVSTVTWRFVETPCREWVRALVQRAGARRA